MNRRRRRLRAPIPPGYISGPQQWVCLSEPCPECGESALVRYEETVDDQSKTVARARIDVVCANENCGRHRRHRA